jgi:hypothetical protein
VARGEPGRLIVVQATVPPTAPRSKGVGTLTPSVRARQGRRSSKPARRHQAGAWHMSSSVGVDERLRFDVLILGAGSAGCVLASRLGEDGRR